MPHVEKAEVKLRTVDFEAGDDLDPLAEGHFSGEREVVHPGFGEGGE